MVHLSVISIAPLKLHVIVIALIRIAVTSIILLVLFGCVRVFVFSILFVCCKHCCIEDSDNILARSLRNLHLTDVIQIVKFAKVLRSRTPISFRQLLFKISFHHYTPYHTTDTAKICTVPSRAASLLDITLTDQYSVEALSMYISDVPCLLLPAAEIVNTIYHDMLENNSIKYLLFDLRSRQEYDNGHLSCAIHIDTLTLMQHIREHDQQYIQHFLQSYQQLHDCHLCFIPHTTNTFQNVLYYYQQQQSINPRNAHSLPNRNISNSDVTCVNQSNSATINVRNFIDTRDLIVNKDEADNQGENEPQAITTDDGLQQSTNTNTVLHSINAINAGQPVDDRPPLPFFASVSLLDAQTAAVVALFVDNGFNHVSVCEGSGTEYNARALRMFYRYSI